MKSVILIHGFASTGKHDVDLLAPFFKDAGYEVIYLDYGFKGFFGATFGNDKQAKKLAQIAPPDSPVVAHSNGAVVFQQASTKYDAKCTRGLLISPALDNRAKFGPGLEKVIVLYSKTDFPLQFAQYIPFHPWGNLGAVGYKGDDKRVVSYDKSKDFAVSSWGHLDWAWNEEKRKFFGPLCVRLLEE